MKQSITEGKKASHSITLLYTNQIINYISVDNTMDNLNFMVCNGKETVLRMQSV